MATWLADTLWKCWYPTLTRLTQNSPVTFLNYGYAEDSAHNIPAPTLDPIDEPNRSCIQLYHRIVSAIKLQNLTVLEISCGHGGGASYIARCLQPQSLTAIDRNPRAIRFCQAHHKMPNLTFSAGNALALNFPSASFDAVINIEASHCYPDMPRFLAEVARVLRPAGHFLYADFRPTRPHLPLLQQQLQASTLDLLRSDNISPQVLRGMQLNTAKYQTLIRKLIPRPFQKPAANFAGIQGSAIYNELQSGQTTYLACHLRKHQ